MMRYWEARVNLAMDSRYPSVEKLARKGGKIIYEELPLHSIRMIPPPRITASHTIENLFGQNEPYEILVKGEFDFEDGDVFRAIGKWQNSPWSASVESLDNVKPPNMPISTIEGHYIFRDGKELAITMGAARTMCSLAHRDRKLVYEKATPQDDNPMFGGPPMTATFRVELNPGQTPNPPYIAKLIEGPEGEPQYTREKLPITNIEIEHTPDYNYRIFANEVYEIEEGDILEIVGDWRVNGRRVAGTVFLVRKWDIASRLGSNYRVAPDPDDEEHISIPLFPKEADNQEGAPPYKASRAVSLYPSTNEEIVKVYNR